MGITAHVRASLRPRSVDAYLAPSLRVGIAVGVPLLVAVSCGWHHWAAYLSLGSLVSLYGKNAPYRERASLLAGVGIALTAAVVIGAAAAGLSNDYLRLLVVAGVAALAKIGFDAAATGPPGGLIVAFSCATTAFVDSTPPLAEVFLMCSVGAVWAWMVCMSGWIVNPYGPLQITVARALRAAAAPDATAPAGRVACAQSVLLARNAIGRCRSARQVERLASLDRAVDRAESTMLSRNGVDDAERGHLRALARDVARRRRQTSASDVSRPARTSTAAPSRLRALLRALHPNSTLMPGAIRTLVGAMAAGAVALALGVGHSYWAAITAVAVLAVTNAAGSLARVLQRVAGSLLGVGIAFAVLTSASEPVLIAMLIIVFVTVGEMLVVRNYGYGMVLITPTAMLLTAIAHPSAAGSLSADRLTDTVIGAAVGVLCAVLIPHPRAHRNVESALAAARTELHRFAHDRTDEARRRLLHALTVLREAHSTASGEYWTGTVNNEEVSQVEHEGFRAVQETTPL
ncbi:hypothetical protein GR168_23110 (plasmid) [Gordonia sp. JH63]|uniref:FUSC family protein n=1 Tax=Gordonia sp. JH63 TaxID=2698900 RepID=UPI0013203679|nr:FUSC family protein [Gordonia sp. JH63]QHD88388.1 hypothetical protein GR168_23110 [Gordonia sp. JH63]